MIPLADSQIGRKKKECVCIYILSLSFWERSNCQSEQQPRRISLWARHEDRTAAEGTGISRRPKVEKYKDFLGNLFLQNQGRPYARKKVGFVHPNVDPRRIIALESDRNILLLKKMGQLLSFTFNKLYKAYGWHFLKNSLKKKDASPITSAVNSEPLFPSHNSYQIFDLNRKPTWFIHVELNEPRKTAGRWTSSFLPWVYTAAAKQYKSVRLVEAHLSVAAAVVQILAPLSGPSP